MNRARYLIDSDVIIWHLRGRAKTVELLQRLSDEGPLACLVLSLTEVMRGAKAAELQSTEALLAELEVFDITREIAIMAASHVRRGLGMVDAQILATCLTYGLTLVTYNHKHFDVPEMNLFDTREC